LGWPARKGVPDWQDRSMESSEHPIIQFVAIAVLAKFNLLATKIK
jgi:hypothetical protein